MNDIRLKLLIAFMVALIMSILPMPQFLAAFRPPWVLLLVLYIEYFIPGKCHITTLLLVGLVLDVLFFTVIGEHSFALLLVTWVASRRSRRFQLFSMMQQIFVIGVFCFLYQATISFIDALLYSNYSLMMPVASALLSMFVWPWIRLLGESSLLKKIIYRSAF